VDHREDHDTGAIRRSLEVRANVSALFCSFAVIGLNVKKTLVMGQEFDTHHRVDAGQA